MASKLIKEYFPKTAEYINSKTLSLERVGHHNYVVEQKVLNLTTPLVKQSKEKIMELDEYFFGCLKNLDKED